MPDILLYIMHKAKLINQQQLDSFDKKNHTNALSYLIEDCKINQVEIAQTVANYYSHNYQSLSHQQFKKNDWQIIASLPLTQWQCLPLLHDNSLDIYMADPNQMQYIDHLKYHFNITPNIIICTQSDFNKAFTHVMAQLCYHQTHNMPSEDHAVSLLDHLLNDAISKNASDIHIEAKQPHSLIRFRLDGLLYNIATLDKHSHQPLLSRLKVLCQLDISEQRKPQDGRFTFLSTSAEKYDCRLSSCPSMHGEKVVIRISHSQQHILQLQQLGLEKMQLKQLQKCKQHHQGLILVTGPTGSGKTNTLYTLLDYLNDQHKNICTIENPIEIELPYLNQISTHANIGLDFNTLLRTLLRQDPDIIMIGEIRDHETAATAIKAAQTGHLVLSTLHTNSCIETIIRLQHMKIPLHHILNTTKLIIAQRLVRKLCVICNNNGKNCSHCQNGYQSRQGLFEILPLNEPFCNYAANHPLDKHRLQQQADKLGMVTLQQTAEKFIQQGITDQAEISRVISNGI
ncbi:MAG: GspE/PulE family protein [Coxiellaceae bacterium]|nr:GspE/PulE family protein [Coxiellaceae bacterium]